MKDSSGKEEECEQLRHVIDQKDATIAEREQQLRQCREENKRQNQQIQQLEREKRQVEREKDQAIQEKVEKERQLGQMNQQLEESEQLIADFGKRNTELEDQLRVMRSQLQEKDGGVKAGAVDRTNLKLRWREGEKAPYEIFSACDAVVANTQCTTVTV